MDENIEYSSEEQMRKISSAWDLAHDRGSSPSGWRDTSNIYLQFENYHLHLVQKMEYGSDRPIIPSTKAERYSYYRGLVTSANKNLIFNTSLGDFNFSFWSYFFGVFFKSLPHTFTTLFLASYSPEEHFFLAKMVPFSYGAKLASIVTFVCNVVVCLHQAVITFGYLVHGVIHKNPWNRCIAKETEIMNDMVACLEIAAFTAKIKNDTWRFNERFYLSANGDKFQLAQITYFRYYVKECMTYACKAIYSIVILLFIVIFHKYIYTRLYWKLQHRLQLTLIGLEIILFLYLMYSYFCEIEAPGVAYPEDIRLNSILARADIQFMAESIAAPPVVHVLTARSMQYISPSQDSFVLCLSNSVIYFFRGFLINRLQNHCKNLAGAPLQATQLNPYSWFYYWPVFFSQFYWGDVFTILFFAINLLVDMVTLMITYHCFLEVVINEWRLAKEWIVNVVAALICVMSYASAKYPDFIYLYLYTTGITNLVEVILIYYLYPVGRLTDDVIFHFGAPPTAMQLVVWRLVPVYYFVKVYVMITYLKEVKKSHEMLTISEICIVFLPYAIGIIYIAFKYMYKDKLTWPRMFIPDYDWGPRDQQVRQLRKQFSSRTFITSQADRHLSRYMMAKREAKAYQLNLNYNPKRFSTMATNRYRMVNERRDS